MRMLQPHVAVGAGAVVPQVAATAAVTPEAAVTLAPEAAAAAVTPAAAVEIAVEIAAAVTADANKALWMHKTRYP